MPDGKAARLLTKLLGKLPHPRAYTDTATDPRGATITQHARPGVSLRAHARELEYHLATCGYALTRPVALVAADTERPVLAGDTLSLPLAALGASGLRLRWLYFDVPRVLIFGPRVS